MNAVVESLKGLGPVKLMTIAGTGIVLLALFAFISFRVAQPPMAPLYSGLSMEDSGEIVKELEAQGVPYTLTANGAQVMVPGDRVLRLRMSMAEKGLPNSGSVVGYEVFDRSEALGTSSFVHNVNYLRALEGELSRTIASFSKIESARVHLVMPKRELFSRDKQEPSASVALKLAGGYMLGKAETQAIQHLVANAIPGLKLSRITIVDNKGKLLVKGSTEDSENQIDAEAADTYRTSLENRLRNTLEALLEQTVGDGKAKVQVAADINFDRITTNSETYDPDSQVARSVQTIEENENSNERDVKDNVSVANNLPDKNADKAGTLSNSSATKTEETTNYEISKVVKNQVQEMGSVNRLSVAVLVDGTYVTDASGQKVYTPRSQEELDKLAALVKSAIGFDAKRGDTVEVVNMPFSATAEAALNEGPLDWLKRDFQSIMQTLVLGVVAVLVILLVIRPLVNRALETSAAAAAEDAEQRAALGGPGGLAGALADLSSEDDDGALMDISRIDGKVKSAAFKKVNDLVAKHPEETLNVLRQWMFNED
ncbi:MAG: flagellar M-ring protein FliF [Alphaproteobacteria bacterium]|nr:flagellar M-ring protein FliF [Alphaproteobacteria bacterium]